MSYLLLFIILLLTLSLHDIYADGDGNTTKLNYLSKLNPFNYLYKQNKDIPKYYIHLNKN